MIRIKVIDKNGIETQFSPKTEEQAASIETTAKANGCTVHRMRNEK